MQRPSQKGRREQGSRREKRRRITTEIRRGLIKNIFKTMAKIDLTKYGITGTTEVVYNPSYDELFREETKAGLTGFDKGVVTEMGAVNVMTGV